MMLNDEKMQKFVNIYNIYHTAMMQTAVAIVAACMAMTISVKAYRMKLFYTMRTALEDCVVLLSYNVIDENTKSQDMTTPAYLPEGYELKQVEIGERCVDYEYCDDMQHYLIFQQKKVTEGEKLLLDATYDSTDTFLANGVFVSVYSYTDKTFWHMLSIRIVYTYCGTLN